MKPMAVIYTTIALVAVSIAVGAVLYDRLPDPVPTHFDFSGNPDGYTAKPMGVFAPAIILAFIGLVFAVLPRMAPRGYALEPFQRAYEIIGIAVLVLVFGIVMLSLVYAVGVPIDLNRIVGAGIGLLFVVMGNFLGKLTRNFFIGIRTPWTLASDEVWLRTHRVGGVMCVVGGVVILAASLIARSGVPLVLLGVVIAIVLFSVVYSYVVYRRVETRPSP